MSFRTRGPLAPDDIYLLRPADDEVEALVRQGDYVALIGPRVSGKTSLLMRLWHTLKDAPRFTLIYANLSLHNAQTQEENWYKALYQQFLDTANGLLPMPEHSVRDAIDMREELWLYLDKNPGQVLMILLDEVESVPMDFRTAFFATLREMFVSRGIQPAFRRMSFVLAGSYIPDELIPDPTISPFRVAQKVYLEDAPDLTPLLNRLNTPFRQLLPAAARRITEWTEGDVYLTQRICERLNQRYKDGQITANAVDQVVERYLTDDDLFTGLEGRVRSQGRVLDTLQMILEQGREVKFARSNQAIARAWLLGCIRPNALGNCIIRNAVYETVLREVIGRIREQKETPVTPAVQARKEREPLHGRYQLESVLKRGMVSHLYRARDLQTGHIVAVKQLLSMRSGDVIAWRRFQRESEVLKRLDHPHIVTLIDTFRVGEYSYIVMEYVGGGTIDSLLSREGRQPIPVVMEMILAVADALRYAHSQHIVHRDIKPSNILLTPDMSPRLADFGLARSLIEHERITATHAVIGTPVYMSPESYTNQNLSPAEDIWSLGVTLYEMLTGMLPFTGRTHEHIRHAIQTQPLPNLRDVRPDIPDALAEVLLMMLERDPDARLQDGEAAYHALLSVKAAEKG